MSQKVVTFGEIMLRLAPPGFQRFIQTRSFDVVFGGEKRMSLSRSPITEPRLSLSPGCLRTIWATRP